MTSRILEGPKYEFTIPQKTLGELFFECCEKYKDKVCQIDGTADKQETYSSIKKRSTRVAIELQKYGVTNKDVIGFCTENTMDTIVPMLAAFYLGAKVVNFAPCESVKQLQYLIGLVSPKIIFVEDKSIGLIEESLNFIQWKARIIRYSSLSKMTSPKHNEETFKPVKVNFNETAAMFFSSGSTGLPKAICHSHSSLIHVGCTAREFDFGKVIFSTCTFYWLTCWFMLMGTFMLGSCRVFYQALKPETVFKIIEKYKVQSMLLSPVDFSQITGFQNAKSYEISSLIKIIFGGIHPTPMQLQKMSEIFKDTFLINMYGMTEVGLCASFNADLSLMKSKPSSCGQLCCGMKLKVVDIATEEILGPNQQGEIRLKSPSMLTGLHKVDSSDILDQDGFFKTGDIGYYDEDNCIYLVDRIKEMFKFCTFHINPSFIEGVLVEHPSVEEAAVFGVPWSDDGEAPAACVVLKTGCRITKEEIGEFVADRVNDKERLRGGITFVDCLPRTPTGKLRRRELKEMIVNNMK